MENASMWPPSSPSKHAVLGLNSTRPSHRRHRRPRLELQLERLEDRQLLSGPSATTVPTQFEFGTATSPIDAGFTKVDASTIYSAALGYGWTQGVNVQVRDRGVGSDMDRAFDFTTSSMTFQANVPNGIYNVSLTSGDADFSHALEGVFIGGKQVDTISTQVNQFVTDTYRVTVTGGSMDLQLVPLAGGTGDALINALVISQTNAPVVNAGSPVTVNAESSLTFSQATESGGTAPFTYSWNFGDGTNQSGTLNPSHTYQNPGSYTATVTVTDANKLTNSRSVVVTVNDVAPTVSLSAPSSGVTGQAVSFTASATSPSPVVQAAGFAYNWSFGDGTTGTGASPNHTYTATGTYTVSVTATDEDGAMSSAAKRILAIVTALTVSAGSNFSTTEGTSVTFAGSASGGAAPYTYSWNFGDNSTGSGATPSHTYKDNGTYTATLSVTDSSAQSGSSFVVVTVGDVPPTVRLSGPSSGTVGASLSFTATATDPSPVNQAAGFTYNWNFGDGGTGSGASTTHTYVIAGNYTVSVTATDEDGETSAAATTVVTVSSSAAGISYYIAPNSGSGAGTFSNPYGLADLTTTAVDSQKCTYTAAGDAITKLHPGDTLYFRAGTYTVSGIPQSTTDAIAWTEGMLWPTHSGTALQPITIRSYAGEAVTIVVGNATSQPVFGGNAN